MTRTQFIGGGFCDARGPDRVVLILDSHLDTARGRVELPLSVKNGLPQNLIYPDIAPGGNLFAGIGNNDDHCWEWDWRKYHKWKAQWDSATPEQRKTMPLESSQWLDRGIAFGPRAVMYDSAGGLHVVTGPPASGYRYQAPDGRMVTATETTADIARQIWEYTDLVCDGVKVTIGQGGKGIYGEDPAIVLIDGTRRLLEAGTCRFIKPRWLNGVVSIPFVREDIPAAVLMSCSLAELRALPPAVDLNFPQPPPPPPPVDPDEPEEPPVPDDYPPQLRDRFDVVESVNRDYPGIIKSDPHRFCDQLAHRLNRIDKVKKWGRKRKNDRSFNDDVVTWLYGPTPDGKHLVDTIAGDDRRPTWDVRPRHEEPGNGTWAPPQSPDRDGSVPPLPDDDNPPPPPPAKTKSKDEIRAAIVELKRFYDEPDGLNRKARGVPSPVTVDDPAFWDWVALAVLEPIDQVKDRIRQFPEYKDQHR